MVIGAAGLFSACSSVAFAGSISAIASDNSNDTWAGDANFFGVPSGTFLAQQYFYTGHSSEYATTHDNLFSKLTGGQVNIPSTLDYFTTTTRLSYYFGVFGHPLMLQAALKLEQATTINVGNLAAPVGGLGPQTHQNGAIWAPPEFAVGYGIIADPRSERFLGITTYAYLPDERFNNTLQFNMTPPRITTVVPELSYAEGLAKVGLPNFWIDVIGNGSFRDHGVSPLSLAPGVQFDSLSQSSSYDIKAFIRYGSPQFGQLAVGIERSWGGIMTASGGVLQAIFGGPTTFGTDDFTKGHVQLAVTLPYDFQAAADVSHDFHRDGGYKENLAIEFRLSKLFMPATPPPPPLLTKAPPITK
jgi:hypothetical protein